MADNINPFVINTSKPLVAIKGRRAGYIQLATSTYINTYAQLPVRLFEAAKLWAAIVETHGAKKIYWITLSEVVDHKHIHLYPRWHKDNLDGLDLFNNRINDEKTTINSWNSLLSDALLDWSNEYDVELIEKT
jgi:diadenosine tetraphosphate (Ap4A) HIT family hydrolase